MAITQACHVADVRRTCGIASDIIEDDDVSRIITEATASVEGFLNTAIFPKTVIEARDSQMGQDSSIMFVKKMPILGILAVKVNGDDVTPRYVRFYPGGKVMLTDDAEETEWDDDEPQSNVIKYIYGMVMDGDTETTTTAAITTPATGTSIAVSSSSGFKVDDWVRIYGMDGYSEVAKITAIADSTHITANIYYPHESGSIVAMQEVPQRVKRLVEIIASMMLVARIVGESYTDIVGYGLEGFNVQKGEPYTQWRETYNQLEAERRILISHLRPMAAMGIA